MSSDNQQMICLQDLKNVEFQGSHVNIADLPEDVQEMVIEHLIQKNNSGQLADVSSSGKLNKTDFVQISELFSPT